MRFDVDITRADALGGRAALFAPFGRAAEEYAVRWNN